MTDDYDEFTKRMTSFDMILGDEDPMAHSEDLSDDILEHYGVKGMKWGVRKSESSSSSGAGARFREVRNTKPQTLELKGKNGETISLRENQKPLISAFAAAAHPKLHENIMNSHSVGLYANGKKVGDADYNFQGKNREELYLNMIQVHPKQRGKGYASTVLDAAVEMGRKEGAKKITLDVPDNAPDAKHIYKKLGFKETGAKVTGDDIDAMWGGGLTPMALDISTDRIKHADPDYNEVDDEELEKAFEQHFQKLYAPTPKPKEGGEVEHINADAFLSHYGVKGMKWGVRRKSAEDRAAASEAKAAKKAAKVEASKTARKEAWKRPITEDAATASASRSRGEKHGTDALSNKELQALVTRMNLEQQYMTLQTNGKAKTARQAGTEYVADILKEVGRDLLTEAVKSAMTSAAKGAYSQATSSNASAAARRASTRVAQRQLEAARRGLKR